MPVIEVESPDGTLLGVEQLGSGPPLLVVHGGIADRSRWKPLAGPLAERFSVHLRWSARAGSGSPTRASRSASRRCARRCGS
jgi:hypothetical protein